MPNLTADEIITQKHVRNYIQFGGPVPGNVVQFSGQDYQYMKVEGVTMPDAQGAIDPVWMHDPQYPGKFKLVARKSSPPDLAASTLVITEKHGVLPRHLQQIRCPLNAYDLHGACKDLSDFVNGWSDYVMVYELGLVSGAKDLGNRSAFGDGDDQLQDSLPMTWADIYPVGALSFGEKAANTITLEVMDVVYWSNERCADCGGEDDGTKWIYAVTKSSGSTPGTAPKMVYTIDGGTTWTTGTVDGLGDTEDPVVIDRVGKYLVIVTKTAGGPTLGGYYYSEVNSKTGVPGTWTKVTSGFALTYPPNDMYVLSPREVFFCADGGVIYKSTDIPSGVSVLVNAGEITGSSLKRIHGKNETIIIVGASGACLKSYNRGLTWGNTTTSPVVDTLQALAVVDDDLYWVGTAGGALYKTLNGGETWTSKSFTGSGAGQVRDIIFPTPSVGYFSHDTATPTGRLFATWDGGEDWADSISGNGPRILSFPTVDRINRIAAPKVSAGIAANNVAVAGLNGNGSDGILALGIAGRL